MKYNIITPKKTDEYINKLSVIEKFYEFFIMLNKSNKKKKYDFNFSRHLKTYLLDTKINIDSEETI
jgi:hypothetical protein